ncbi:unnamed protein product [Acanthoscelides obtectus]|uniref:Uncharacterized protein n=1 Tax=Acanthoscelides obtectus TaxID=200917 RepID=A0A9P0M4Q0_ACAOB|nr:unnamed protein product [Acanthoscelides obtectus]CAK1630323.1 hypothetical protein AOBTE_LOCUS6262 [Acanthoscelides obtectus]
MAIGQTLPFLTVVLYVFVTISSIELNAKMIAYLEAALLPGKIRRIDLESNIVRIIETHQKLYCHQVMNMF